MSGLTNPASYLSPTTAAVAASAAPTGTSAGGTDFLANALQGLLTGLGGSGGSMFGGGGGRSRENIEEAYEDLEDDTRGTFNDLGNVFGVSPTDLYTGLQSRYQAYIEPAAQRGYNYLFNFEPRNLGTDRMAGQLQSALGQFSLLNNPRFQEVASNPGVISIDAANMSREMMEPMKEVVREGPYPGGMFDYSAPQSTMLRTEPGTQPLNNFKNTLQSNEVQKGYFDPVSLYSDLYKY